MAEHDQAVTEDEAALAPFFAAARAEAPAPGTALLSAIIADAAEASARRSPPARRRRFGLLDGLGGWRVAAPLAAAAVAGFWVGLAADLDIANPSAWVTTTESADDPVAAFFDLAAAEN